MREHSPFTQSQLNAARERQFALARAVKPAPRNSTGLRVTHQFDPVAWQHIQRHPSSRDPDFNKYLSRAHPETVIPHDPSGFIGGEGSGGTPRNRFGKIKSRFIPGIGWVNYDAAAKMDDSLGDPGLVGVAHV